MYRTDRFVLDSHQDRLPNAALKYFAILRLYAPTEAIFDETTSRRSGDRG